MSLNLIRNLINLNKKIWSFWKLLSCNQLKLPSASLEYKSLKPRFYKYVISFIFMVQGASPYFILLWNKTLRKVYYIYLLVCYSGWIFRGLKTRLCFSHWPICRLDCHFSRDRQIPQSKYTPASSLNCLALE